MGYYQGDMYRGDFFGSIGKIFSTVRKVASPVFSALGGVMSHPSAAATSAIAKVGSAAGPIVRRGAQAVIQHPVLAAAGVASAAATGVEIMRAGAKPSRTVRVHPVTGQVMRHRRRMRVTNTKALHRALRRVYGFSRIARKVIRITHPHTRGRMGFRRPRKRRAA